MKIGIFTESYLPTPTGVAISVETFRRSLIEMGHEVYVFCPEFKTFKDKTPNIYRFPSFFFSRRKDAPIVWPFISFDLDNLRKIGFDVIHTMHFFTLGTYGLKIAKKLDIPLVHTYHTNYEEYAKNYVPRALVPLAKRLLIGRSRSYCNKCDLVISPSPSMAKQIKSYGITSQIEPLPTGINLGEFKSLSSDAFRKKYKIRKDGKIILFVGRLGEEKNISFLLDSFIKVLKDVDSNLVFVGSGPAADGYKRRVKKENLSHKVYFLGFLPKAEVNQIYGACDLFAFPSLTDTQGLVVVEAMAAGVVPVAMDKLGPSDIITHGKDGLLSKLNDDDFTNNIIKVLSDDSLRQKLSKNALLTAENYSQDSVTKKLLGLYRKATSNHNSAC